MKTIKNKETSIPLKENEKVTYAYLLSNVVNQPVKQGITIKQMKEELALLSKFDSVEVDVEIEVTEEELEKVKMLLDTYYWGIRHADITEFGDYIESL